MLFNASTIIGFCATLLFSAVATAAPIVVIAGATGETGVLVVRALKERGYTVRGLVRDIPKAKATHGDLAEWWLGDARNPPAALATAFAGADYAVSVIGSREISGDNSFENVDWAGNRNLIDAARIANAKRFVLMSAGSAGPNAVTNQRFGAGRAWKFKAEEYLRQSGLDYAIIAPGGLRNTPAGEKSLVLKPRNAYAVGVVARGDVAALIAECLTNIHCSRKTITAVNGARGTPEPWIATLAALPADTPDTILAKPNTAPKEPLP